MRDVETDASTNVVLRDESGALLIGQARAVRGEVWDRELWPEMALSIAPEPICASTQFKDSVTIRFTLASGADRCAVDGGTVRCCQLDGRSYQVLCTHATRSAAKKYPKQAHLIVARPGTLTFPSPALLAGARD